jgi:hypothetical protein
MIWTYCGILLHHGYGAAFLVNFPTGSTRVWFSYKYDRPVRIVYAEEP